MTRAYSIMIFASALALASCSDAGEGQAESRSHVWEGQTQALDRARAVENTMGERAAEQANRIEEQTD